MPRIKKLKMGFVKHPITTLCDFSDLYSPGNGSGKKIGDIPFFEEASALNRIQIFYSSPKPTLHHLSRAIHAVHHHCLVLMIVLPGQKNGSGDDGADDSDAPFYMQIQP